MEAAMRLGRGYSSDARTRTSGFTLIELLVVLVVIAILSSLIAPSYLSHVDQARETVLRQNLHGLRVAIDQYYEDKGNYPNSLTDLVEQRYLRSVPLDPVTERSDTWVVVSPSGETGPPVFDVRSGAKGKALAGESYATW